MPVRGVQKLPNDTIDELDTSLAIVTETWLADGLTLEEDKQGLLLGAGLSMICKNHAPDVRGLAYGGVAILSYTRRMIAIFKMSSSTTILVTLRS